jgi:hypothetical protein
MCNLAANSSNRRRRKSAAIFGGTGMRLSEQAKKKRPVSMLWNISSATFAGMPDSISNSMYDDDSSDTIPCSYCGASIYDDSPRCPKCGNYTDGLGDFGKHSRPRQGLPTIYLIGGWLALIALLVPVLMGLYYLYQRFIRH